MIYLDIFKLHNILQVQFHIVMKDLRIILYNHINIIKYKIFGYTY